jgi:predicted dehydrogenase
VVAAIGLDHGHINGMCQGLTDAGAQLKWAYDPDTAKAEALAAKFPGARVATSEAQVLEDDGVQLVASAGVPADHAALGARVLGHGKDYFSDKPALTTMDQLEQARQAVARTGRKWAVYYSERVHVESAVFAGQLVKEGAIGRVLQVTGLGPHRADLASRPPWFYQRDRYGGILCDIGSHQAEQFLYFTDNTEAEVTGSRVANYAHKDHPGLEDFGDCNLLGANGATGYFRVDWFTPDGLRTWGDGRLFLLGTQGYIELRKYIEVAGPEGRDHVYMVDGSGEHHFAVSGTVGYPYFGQLVLDCLERTERAMTQEHVFKAAELCLRAELNALRTE